MENNKLLQKVFLIGSFVVLILPLLNLPPLFSPPDWGKTIVFRIVFSILLLFVAWNIRHIPLPPLKKKESLSLVFLLLLVGLFFLATLFSFDQNFSLWGNPARSGGFVNFALIILFAILAFVLFRENEWQKAWDVAIFAGGVPVALFGVFQWLGWFSTIILARASRPQSTLGNDIQLGIYLILLLFPAIAFLFQAKGIKKIAYALACALFLFVIILTGSRGAYLGLSAGFAYFILLYPVKKLWHSLALKFAFFGIMLIPFLSIYYLNTHLIPKLIQKNETANTVASRLQLEQFIRQEPRFSTWKVGWEAIKAKPLLGYGPENFEIGFDRYYNPQLPNIEYQPQSSNTWWDRAHNFLVDNASQAGIPALLVYLSIFGVLLWQLQKLKDREFMTNSQLTIMAHGLQATFIGYLVADLFGFDTFSTYLLSFLSVAFAFFLVQGKEQESSLRIAPPFQGEKVAIGILAVVFLWFNWQFNLKPLEINSKINEGVLAMGHNLCGLAVNSMEKALGSGSTFLDAYANAQYFDVLRKCQAQASGDSNLLIAQKYYALMKRASVLWPFHTRNWIFLGQISALLAQEGERKNAISPQQKEELLKESDSYFEKSVQLSPKHQEIYMEWAKARIAVKDYGGAVEKAKTCAQVDPRTPDCWWIKALAQVYMNDLAQSSQNLNFAYQRGLRKDNQDVLLKFANAYALSKNYGKVVKLYETLVQLDPQNIQYHSSLAATYKAVGLIQKARQEALRVLQLDPTTKNEVNAFLQSL